MSTENEVIEDVVDVADITPTVDDEGNDTTDWKAVAEMNRDLALKNRGIAQRFKTKYEKSKEVVPVVKNDPIVSNDLGEKAYLAINGIKSADEVEFFRKMKKETGKDAEALLDSTYFQTEFNSFKEKKTTDIATPTGSKRSSNSSSDSVEYWIAKGELPPASEVQLRRDVVNARIKKETSSGVFYNS
jgi:hypothetical protein